MKQYSFKKKFGIFRLNTLDNPNKHNVEGFEVIHNQTLVKTCDTEEEAIDILYKTCGAYQYYTILPIYLSCPSD